MVDFNLIKELELLEPEAGSDHNALLTEADDAHDTMEKADTGEIGDFKPGTILNGRVVGFAGDDVVVDVGFKSEGLINKNEFPNFDQVKPGDKLEVLLENLVSDDGVIQLSKRKADRIRGWERIVEEKSEGDEVVGTVMRKIKGGLLVDIGVPVFLPASQVDIRRPPDIGAYVGKEIRAQVLKIDTERRNIVISRRKLVEEERSVAREKLLSTLEVGSDVDGTVKNLADFGAFVDIGGLDGLLHITDMSWGRINHPSEMLEHNQKIKVRVLNIDRESEKVALGLKQLTDNPWANIDDQFPIGGRIKGTVVNIVAYGSFVKLDEGIEGLVHISEMSWTKRVNHPSEVVSVGEEVEVVVLDINKDKQEISLGIKQAESNPWDLVAEKYPPGTVIEGTVRNLTNYGAFIEIEPGVDGMLHVSDLSWTKKVAHPNEILKKAEPVRCIVLEVDQNKQRISLGVKQLTEDPWDEAIPKHYLPGMVVSGAVTKITNFGVFVELEDNLEGLLHISELSEAKVENPQDIVAVGQEVEVKILRVDMDERKIGLSLKRAQLGDAGGEIDPSKIFEPSTPKMGGMNAHTDVMGTDKISFGPAKEDAPTEEGSKEEAPKEEAPKEEE
jgi:small subunit ribosomal protein S1